MGRRIILEDHKAKLRDRQMEIVTADGQVFLVDPPELWPDAVDTAADEAAVARIVFGADRYQQFVDAGGNARIFGSLVKEGWDATVPE